MADVGMDLISLAKQFLTPRQAPEPPKPGQQPPPPAPTPPNLAPNVAPPAPPAPAPGTVQPPTPTDTRTLAADGGLSQFMAIQKAAQEAQRKAQLGSALASGGAALGAALTRSPSMRESLTSISGHRAGGAGGGDGVGNLTADAFLGFQKRADLLQERGRLAANLPGLAKRLNIAQSDLQTVLDTNPQKVADLIKDANDPTMEFHYGDDGRMIGVRKNAAPGEQPRDYGIVDPEKVQAGKRADVKQGLDVLAAQREELAAPGARDKTAADTAQSQATTRKTDEDVIAAQEKNKQASELRTIMSDPVMRKALAEQLGTTEGALYTSFVQGKSDEVLANNMKATPLYQDWLKTDRTQSWPDFFKAEQRAHTVSPTSQSTGIIIKQVGERADKIYEGAAAMDGLEAMRSRIDSGVYAGSLFQDYKSRAARELGGIFNIDNSKLAHTQEYEGAMKAAAGKIVKQWGSNASENDAARAEQAIGGSLKVTEPATIRWMLGFQAKAQVWETMRHNQDIDDKIARTTNPDTKEALAMHKQALPDPDRIAKLADIPADSIAALRADPTSAKARAAFDKEFGRGLAPYFLGEVK